MINIQELKSFNNACDEFITGKYILVDIKIASILKLISDDEKLKNTKEFKEFGCDDYITRSFSSLMLNEIIYSTN